MLYDIKKKLKTGINNSIKNDFVAFVGLIVSLLIIVYGYYKFVLKTSSCLYELKQNNEKIVNCDKEIKLVYLTDITLYK